jgi:hypothetical protein
VPDMADLPEWWVFGPERVLNNASGGAFAVGQRSRTYFMVLGGYPPEAIMLAITVLLATPQPFRRDGIPSIDEIHERITQDDSIPTWGEAWPVIKKIIIHHRNRPATAIAELETDHQVLAEFVKQMGQRRLLTENTDHEVYGRKVLADLGAAYDEVVRRYQERRRNDHLIATSPQLEAARGPRGQLTGVGDIMDRLLNEAPPVAPQLERGSDAGDQEQ